MEKNSQMNQKSPKSDKFFSKDNIVGIVAFAIIILVALYVISTHFNLPKLIVPSNAVEMVYPPSIFTGNVEDIADGMKGTEGIYRVKVNEDNSLTVKLSPERYEKIKEAAKNNMESLMLLSIGNETAVREYISNEDFTSFDVLVVPSHENLEAEISNAVYSISLYHICNMNNDVTFTINYLDVETEEMYKSEIYNTECVMVEDATE